MVGRIWPLQMSTSESPRLWIHHLMWQRILADVIKIKDLEIGGDSGIPRWPQSNDVCSSRLERGQRNGSERWEERRTPLSAVALRMEEEERGPWTVACRSWEWPTVSSKRVGAAWVLPLEDFSSDTAPGTPPSEQETGPFAGTPKGAEPTDHLILAW